MFTHYITEFYKILNIHSTLIPISHVKEDQQIQQRRPFKNLQLFPFIYNLKSRIKKKSIKFQSGRIRQRIICWIQIDNSYFPEEQKIFVTVAL